MQEILCSMCSGNADMMIVDGLTYTVCGECGNIHVAETEQYIRFDTSRANGEPPVRRRILIMVIALEAIFTVWDQIYNQVQKKYRTVSMGE